MIYLDNAATTRVSNEVIDEMIDYFSKGYANSSSNHSFGHEIKRKVEDSRMKVANLINAEKNEIYFTSGATEAINLALRGFVEASVEVGSHIITTKVEHKAVLETCNYLENIGIDVTYLDVDQNGLIDLVQLEESLKPETILVSILWVNNETGIIQKLDLISEIVNKSNAKLFIDATQAVGKIPVDVKSLGVDMLCLSAHKFYGPKGIGALYAKESININPLVYGGGQENGLRSGTSNVPGIVGLAKACEIAELDNLKAKKIIQHLENEICKNFDCEIVGNKSKRSPFITNILFDGIDADIVIGKLNDTIVSTGSACTSELNEPSHVLKEMNFDDQKAYGSIRFSISKETTINDIDLAIEELKSIIL